MYEAGEMLLLDDDTIRKYRNIYLNQRAKVLLIDDYKARKPLLTMEQLKVLEKHICAQSFMDSKGIVCWIENNSVSGILQRVSIHCSKDFVLSIKNQF